VIANYSAKYKIENEDRRQIAGENRRKNYVFQRCKLRDYFTEVHQICTRCSQIIAIEPFESGLTIGQFVVERQSKE